MKKKLLFTFILCAMISYAQNTSPLQKTPEQLASEMVISITTIVNLTSSQQENLTLLAIQYFSDIRKTKDNNKREQLYISFNTALQQIMTPDVYKHWRSEINKQHNLHINTNTTSQAQ